MLFKSAYLGDTEIVKAYKGDTLFYEKGGGGGYVTDGLILNLDGLLSQRTSTEWIDLVGNVPFALNGSCSFETDGVVFNGGYLYNATVYPYSTIEIVFKTNNLTNFETIYNHTTAALSIFINKNQIAFGGYSGTGVAVPLSTTNLVQISAVRSGDILINPKINGVNNEIAISDGWSRGSSGSQFGAYGTAHTYPLNGKICAIRMYDRVLTDAERTQNYQYDVQRFGLS